MKYYEIDFMGNTRDKSLYKSQCILTDVPNYLGRRAFRAGLGIKLGKDWPADARMTMDKDFPGTKMGSLIGNPCNYLVCHRDVGAVMQEVCSNEIELLPLTILNHRKRPVSDEYVVVNVIGTVDCLDDKASGIERFEGDVVGMDDPVIDARRLPADLDLFRPAAAPSHLIMSLNLGRALAKKKFTNFALDEVKVINRKK